LPLLLLLLLLLLLVVLPSAARRVHSDVRNRCRLASDDRRIHSIFLRSMDDWRHRTTTSGISTSADTKGEPPPAVRCRCRLTFSIKQYRQ